MNDSPSDPNQAASPSPVTEPDPSSSELRVPSRSVVTLASSRYEGPLPDPQTMAGYGSIDPSFPERTFSYAEREQAHRHALESKIVDQEGRGQIFGFIVALFAMLMSIAAASWGMEKLAMVLGGSTVLGLVTIFVTGRYFASRSQDKDDQPS